MKLRIREHPKGFFITEYKKGKEWLSIPLIYFTKSETGTLTAAREVVDFVREAQDAWQVDRVVYEEE